MTFLCWNCQGLGALLTVQALRAIVAQERPKVIFLSETKNQEGFVHRIAKRLNFQHLQIVNLRGIGGGLTLLWSEEASILIQSATDNFIDIKYDDIQLLLPFPVTFIYALALFQQRIHTWG